MEMVANDSQSVEELLSAAMSLPQGKRGEFLDRACHGAPMLRELLEQMMEEQEIPSNFLGAPALGEFEGVENLQSSLLPALAEETPRFKPGDLVAGRFKVARFIARGGMGEVYEVQDHFLQDTSVALKIVRPHIAADPYLSHRFEQEVLLARKVNHRSLCPIYDIFRCLEPSPPFLFFTMKLLSGESLDARLKRAEPIPIVEGLQICDQLIEGVKAMHSVGIIHRDIKPNNVMLEQNGVEVCVTIMDFGLARLSEASATLSNDGLIAGTPGYLAPELLRGASPSQASDLYALGIVMHQILTGSRPAVTKNGRIAVDALRLERSKAPPMLAHAIAELLCEEPERRCAAFEALTHYQAPAPAEFRLPRISRRSFAFGSAGVLCSLAGGAYWKRSAISNSFHPLPKKRFVALLKWPPSPDTRVAPMLLGLIDSMVDALSRAEAFDHDFYVACQTSLTEMKTPAQVNDVCESLGTNLILATSGAITADGILLTLQVLSTGSAKLLRSRNLHVSTADQFSLPRLATHAAAQLLDVGSLEQSGTFHPAGTKNPESLAAFQAAEALMKEANNSGLDAAIEKFRVAVDLDPHFATAHARLAYAYHLLFLERHDATSQMLAQANAETALTLDPDSIEGHAALASVYEDTGNSAQALREYAKALAPDPSNSLISIRQAHVYFTLNQWQEAEEVCKRILKARPNFWEAYNGLGATYSFQGKYQEALRAFQAASLTAPRNAMTVANAAQMLFLLGETEQAESMIAKSISLAPLAWTLGISADIRRAQGRFAESLEAALKAVSIDPGEDTAWLRAGDAYSRMKRREREAADSYKRALAMKAEQLRIDQSQGGDWMQMALYQMKTGDRTSAWLSIKKAEELNAVDIYSLVVKVRVLALLGRHAEALATLDKCLQMGATSIQIQSTNDLESLR